MYFFRRHSNLGCQRDSTVPCSRAKHPHLVARTQLEIFSSLRRQQGRAIVVGLSERGMRLFFNGSCALFHKLQRQEFLSILHEHFSPSFDEHIDPPPGSFQPTFKIPLDIWRILQFVHMLSPLPLLVQAHNSRWGPFDQEKNQLEGHLRCLNDLERSPRCTS